MDATERSRAPREGVLRRRLLGAFLVLALVPLFGSNAIGYLRSRVIVRGLVTRYLDGMAALEAAHVQGRVEQRLLYLTAIGNGNSFLEAAARRGADPRAVEGMAAVANRAAVEAYLKRKLDESGHFGALALFTPSGALIASTHDDHEVNAWSPSQETSVGLLRSRDVTAPPTLRLMVPVASDPAAPEGYLVATIPLERGGEFLEIPRHVAGAIESFIVDERGRPVFVSHPHGPIRYDRPLSRPLLAVASGGHAEYRNPEGEEIIAASAPLTTYGWRFLAEVPAADALGELGALRNLSLMLGALFAVLVLGASWFLAGGIVAPVRRLVSAARSLGAGDLEVRVPDLGRDEIGELSRAFNEMAEELAANQDRLELLHRREIERAQQLATVGELASGVAHEIKNPVVGISNGLDLVLRRVDDPGLQPITTEMQRQLARIEGAVRDLLAFARPPEPRVAPADVNHLVTRALSLVGPAAGKKRVEVVPKLSERLPELGVDAELLRQAVVNLLMNAVQVSSEGSAVTVETGVRGDQVSVAVSDDGPGLGPHELEQIFKPFYTTRHAGTGLGLPITRGIVEQHGGTLEVESEPGRGARFTILIPMDATGGGSGAPA